MRGREPGSASLVKDKAIGFVFTKDTDLLVVVEDGNKTPSCISELACDLAQKSGLTELSLADHNLTQLMEDNAFLPNLKVYDNKLVGFDLLVGFLFARTVNGC